MLLSSAKTMSLCQFHSRGWPPVAAPRRTATIPISASTRPKRSPPPRRRIARQKTSHISSTERLTPACDLRQPTLGRLLPPVVCGGRKTQNRQHRRPTSPKLSCKPSTRPRNETSPPFGNGRLAAIPSALRHGNTTRLSPGPRTRAARITELQPNPFPAIAPTQNKSSQQNKPHRAHSIHPQPAPNSNSK